MSLGALSQFKQKEFNNQILDPTFVNKKCRPYSQTEKP